MLPILLTLLACQGDPSDETGGDGGASTYEAAWPEWAWRHWVWEGESTEESLSQMVDGYADNGIDVAAVIIDSPWETAYNDFNWDPKRFPDPQGTIDALHERDIRVLLWIVPGINVDAGPIYDQWAENGWFMQQDVDSGPAVVTWWKGEGSLIDYWNPEALAAWHALMDPVLALGIDGWKCDGLDFSAITANYSPALGAEVVRNEYSEAYYRDFHDYTRQVLGEDRIITARPVDTYGADLGGAGVSFAPVDITWAGWVGDQDATFDGLRMALRNFYWSAEAGYLAFGSDIGGYRTEDHLDGGRTKELFLRWAQVGAFSPVMENGGGGEHWPWRFDTETVDIYRGLVDRHHAMLPWLTARGALAFTEGRSLMTFLDDQGYAYLLGDQVLVAPVLEEGGTVTVKFPEGSDWRWLFGDGRVFQGGTTEALTLALDEFSAFAQVGSEADLAFGGG